MREPRARRPVGGGGAVDSFVAVEERGSVSEHHGGDGRTPPGDVLVECSGVPEHVRHVRYRRDGPAGDVLVERVGVLEHGPHVCDLPCIP